MGWRDFNSRWTWSVFAFIVGVATIMGAIFWGIKVQRILGLTGEIARVEKDLAAGQQLWRQFAPLEPKEKMALKEAQERLLQMLPEDKDLPALLQEVSRLTHEYHLSDVSFKTDDLTAPGSSSAVAASTAAKKKNPAEESEPVAYFPVQLSFAGDYREVAYFLEALQHLPRLVRIESLKVQRGVPLIVSEVTWKAYYKNGDLPVIGK